MRWNLHGCLLHVHGGGRRALFARVVGDGQGHDVGPRQPVSVRRRDAAPEGAVAEVPRVAPDRPARRRLRRRGIEVHRLVDSESAGDEDERRGRVHARTDRRLSDFCAVRPSASEMVSVTDVGTRSGVAVARGHAGAAPAVAEIPRVAGDRIARRGAAGGGVEEHRLAVDRSLGVNVKLGLQAVRRHDDAGRNEADRRGAGCVLLKSVPTGVMTMSTSVPLSTATAGAAGAV